MPKQPKFLKKPMTEMTQEEWESLCDGCGQCCCHRANHPETGEEVRTNLACRGLNLQTVSCQFYNTRQQEIPHCIKLTPENIHDIYWLPETCGYRCIAAGEPLPDWHHLICNDREEVHRRGISKRAQLLPDSTFTTWLENGQKEEEKTGR